MSSRPYDVVIIGSGPGGLAAAAGLARAGMRVVVLEQHFAVGGNAQTFRRHKQFDFDVGVHTLDDCGPDGAIPRILEDVGAAVKFRAMDPDGFDVLRFPDREFRVPTSWEAYRTRLHQAFPAQRNTIDAYVDFLLSVLGRVGMGPSFTKLLLRKRPSRLLGPLLRGEAAYLDRPRRMPGGPNADAIERRMGTDFLSCTLGQLFDALDVDNVLRHVLGGQNGLYGTCWSRASTAIHALVMDRYLRGGYYPEGGSKALVAALVRAIEQAGGAIRTRCHVTRILIDEGRTRGVELANGELVRSSLVISDADARRTMLELVPERNMTAEVHSAAIDKTMALPLFVIYLALEVAPATLGLQNANYWLFPAYDLDQQYAACYAGNLPERPMVYVSIASLKDPDNRDLAPPGYTNLQLMALAPCQAAAWGSVGRPSAGHRYRHTESYRAAKRCYEQRMIDVVQEMMPGLIRNIRWKESATPLTQERFTRSSDGTGYGLDHTPAQFLGGRFPIISPIGGLYLVGANTVFGHGVTGALLSARACVQTVLGEAS